MTTKQVQSVNGTIEYIMQGNGKALILLHGASASAVANWQSTIDKFSVTRKVIAINLPGAGNTTWNKDSLSLSELIGVVKTVVDSENEKSFDVVGYSAGAMIALAFTATHPELVSRVIAMAPWVSNARQEFFFNFWGRLLKTDKELFARYNTLTALSINAHGYMNTEAFEGVVKVFGNTGFNDDLTILIKSLETMNIEPYLSQIKANTKIIGFTYDLIAPINQAKEIATKIDGAVFSEIQAGHAGPWEATDVMNNEIEGFIK